MKILPQTFSVSKLVQPDFYQSGGGFLSGPPPRGSLPGRNTMRRLPLRSTPAYAGKGGKSQSSEPAEMPFKLGITPAYAAVKKRKEFETENETK